MRCAAPASSRACNRRCASTRSPNPTSGDARCATSKSARSSYSPPAPATPFSRPIPPPRCGGERKCEIVLKATKVDGVYTADPLKDAGATRYLTLTFDEAIVKNLKVMDATALALCRDQNMLLKVFSIFVPGALKRVVMGADEGTLVHCATRPA